jgi:D-glycero-D-manno-heptose 1,7-bisphosphate phosphatase
MLAIDADGTIRNPKSGSQFISNPEDQEPIEEALDFLKAVKKQGHRIYVVTNQGGIAAGYKTLSDAILEQRITLELFPMVSAVCMADDYTTSNFWLITHLGEQKVRGPLGVKARKPNPGMLKYLECLLYQQHQTYWMVGDSDDDAGAAESAGWDYLHISEALKIGKLPQ